MTSDLAARLARAVASKDAIHTVDEGLLFRHGAPRAPASDAQVAQAEQRLGRQLDPDYLALLRLADGIAAIFNDNEVFGVADLGQGEKWEAATDYLAEIRAINPDQVPEGSKVMVIGGSPDDASLLIQGSEGSTSTVTWLANGVVGDQWNSMGDFLDAAVLFNEATLKDLVSDTPLSRVLAEVRVLRGGAGTHVTLPDAD